MACSRRPVDQRQRRFGSVALTAVLCLHRVTEFGLAGRVGLAVEADVADEGTVAAAEHRARQPRRCLRVVCHPF